MKYAGVVVLYEPKKKNIENIKNYIDSLDVLYVVDNSNKNNKSKMPKNKKIKYIANCDNLGIAKALNIGCQKAIKSKYKWILTMDQDSHIDNKIINDMKKYIEKNNTENIGIISPYHEIVTLQKKPKIDVEKVLEVMTSGNMLNLDLYQKIGGFKDWLFIDDVDIEYCLNLNKNGYDVIRLNYITMKHNLGNSKIVKILNRKYVCSNHSAIRRYYMIRNMFYINKLYKDTFPSYCKFLKAVQRGQIKNVIFFEKDKLNKITYMIRGYIDYTKNKVGKYNR